MPSTSRPRRHACAGHLHAAPGPRPAADRPDRRPLGIHRRRVRRRARHRRRDRTEPRRSRSISEPGATCTVTDTWSRTTPPASTTTTTTAPDTRSASAAAAPAVDPGPVITPQVAGQTTPRSRCTSRVSELVRRPKVPWPAQRLPTYGSQADAVNRRQPHHYVRHECTRPCSMDVAAAGAGTSGCREVTQPAGYFRIDTISTGTSSQTSDNTTSAPYFVRSQSRTIRHTGSSSAGPRERR